MSQRVTCANCGFLNEPGDEFCGDCGTYLAWSGAQGGPGDTTVPPDQAATTPPTATYDVGHPTARDCRCPSSATCGSATTGSATTATRGRATGVSGTPQPTAAGWSAGYQVMPPPAMGGQPCRTCGLVNPPGRTFCQRCGQRLDPAVGTMAGSPRPATGPSATTAATSSGSGGKRLAIAGSRSSSSRPWRERPCS